MVSTAENGRGVLKGTNARPKYRPRHNTRRAGDQGKEFLPLRPGGAFWARNKAWELARRVNLPCRSMGISLAEPAGAYGREICAFSYTVDRPAVAGAVNTFHVDDFALDGGRALC